MAGTEVGSAGAAVGDGVRMTHLANDSWPARGRQPQQDSGSSLVAWSRLPGLRTAAQPPEPLPPLPQMGREHHRHMARTWLWAQGWRGPATGVSHHPGCIKPQPWVPGRLAAGVVGGCRPRAGSCLFSSCPRPSVTPGWWLRHLSLPVPPRASPCAALCLCVACAQGQQWLGSGAAHPA